MQEIWKDIQGYEGLYQVSNLGNVKSLKVGRNYLREKSQYKQIILKNPEGVFVVTPALNKSFKFQSDWPNNTSQIYLLKAVL